VGTLEGDWRAVELAGSAAAAGAGPPEPGLWPGLYRLSDGTLRALHAPDVPFPDVAETGWRERLAALADDAQARVDLAPVLSCSRSSAWVRRHWCGSGGSATPGRFEREEMPPVRAA
jgi:hypothetical protein